jgi:hypothetical protein
MGYQGGKSIFDGYARGSPALFLAGDLMAAVERGREQCWSQQQISARLKLDHSSTRGARKPRPRRICVWFARRSGVWSWIGSDRGFMGASEVTSNIR